MVVIFRTQSDVEASIVSGLLEAHGVRSLVSASVTHAVFPLTVSDLGEVRISVDEKDADEARAIIEGHRAKISTERVTPFPPQFEVLQQAIGYRFRDRALLEQAMTHTSRAHEDGVGSPGDNESLEFLGDALLGFVVADSLFREFPDLDEGQKSKLKASMVSTATLAKLAGELGLGSYLLLGRGEEKTGGRQKPALLADAYEALIAAIYLDGGVDHAREFIVRRFEPLFEEVREHGLVRRDFKSALQEHLQALNQSLPEYRVRETSGPDHRRVFEVEVLVQHEALATGRGASKKDAEQEAAKAALERLTGPERR